ncbi:1,4-dihydroxy-2-naphthoate polyprenyltransferase [Fulvivirgaceae bacterium BMA12]|uniref:1,4-dihydroxy-2-naphthoate octaprenyltransferase n=1 Tax=Agaribacillus aureus TaxID=3051825 RepID=A0ABT8L376_9BACT|nr:1,4-dihydroxy-2-naphthoate polyprenyltransferase [Fulvivirgaceae bacterium BMA12]
MEKSANIKSWISAFRLRTLPLALASIGMGSFLAASVQRFNMAIFVLCATTTICLQILSNLANDYGDSVNGADHEQRQGPSRAVQAGHISAEAMKRGIVIFVVLSLLSGIYLLYIALGWNLKTFLFFLATGLGAILAAMAYTIGKKPYGYIGLGDLSVLLFFGIVGVIGSFYLYTGLISWQYLFPALSCGLFSMAVLNVNNIRDIASDKLAGKMSIPVRIGRKKAVIYHWVLLITGLLAALVFTFLNFNSYFQLLFLITVPLLLKNGIAVAKNTAPRHLDPYLKQMALTTLLFVLTFGFGLLI